MIVNNLKLNYRNEIDLEEFYLRNDYCNIFN